MTPQYIYIDSEGDKFYFKDRDMNIPHRTDGPAVDEFSINYKAWFIDGKRHRTDGPAVEYADGSKAWWINGKRHREDGPAIEFGDGSKVWYIDGNNLSEEEFNLRTAPEIVLSLDEIAAKLGIEVSKLKIKK